MPATPPDTAAYLFLGLLVVFGALTMFLAETVVRYRRARQIIAALESSQDR